MQIATSDEWKKAADAPRCHRLRRAFYKSCTISGKASFDRPVLRDRSRPFARMGCSKVLRGSRRQRSRASGGVDGLHVVFGLGISGRAFPEHADAGPAALGKVVAGPSAFLDLLKLRLGLSHEPVARVVRVAKWSAKLAAVEGKPPFWSASSRVDFWSTAEATLAMRDELVASGWTAESSAAGERLADFAQAETRGPALPPGSSDFQRAIIAAIRLGRRPRLQRLDLLDAVADLPSEWRDLVSALRDTGTAVSTLSVVASAPAGTDLHRLQRYLATGEREASTGDGTVSILKAKTSLAAAEAVSEWLASGRRRMPAATVVASTQKGFLLDLCLTRRAMPILGLSGESPMREPLQVIPAIFAVIWRPLDAAALLHLLRMPVSPLPRWVAGHLADALVREPGTGGPAWAAAWRRILENCREGDNAGNPVEQWRNWTDVARFDRHAGMPVTEAIALCRSIHDWAATAKSPGHDPALGAMAALADSLAEAFSTLPGSQVSAHQVGLMMRTAMGNGTRLLGSEAQASPASALHTPSSLWGRTPTLIWWDTRNEATGRRRPWTDAEQAALASVGCILPDGQAAQRRHAQQLLRAVCGIERTLVLVEARLDAADEERPHCLRSMAGPVLDGCLVESAEALLDRQHSRFADRHIARLSADRRQMAQPVEIWPLNGRLAALARNRTESATTLSDLVECPLRWLLSRVAGLKPSGVPRLPAPGRLLGELAHAVALAAFEVGRVPDPEAVEAAAAQAVDRLVAERAAPLQAPEMAAALSFARRRIPRSLKILAGLLASHDALVHAMEADHARPLDGMHLQGRLDMVVKDGRARTSVIDLKWTGFPGIRVEEIARGRAIQLAAYLQLLGGEHGDRAGYYLIRQEILIAPPGMPIATESIPPVRGLRDTWHAVVARREAVLRGMDKGSVSAAGLVGHGLARYPSPRPDTPPCGNCDMRGLCMIPKGDAR